MVDNKWRFGREQDVQDTESMPQSEVWSQTEQHSSSSGCNHCAGMRSGTAIGVVLAADVGNPAVTARARGAGGSLLISMTPEEKKEGGGGDLRDGPHCRLSMGHCPFELSVASHFVKQCR